MFSAIDENSAMLVIARYQDFYQEEEAELIIETASLDREQIVADIVSEIMESGGLESVC